MIYTRFGTPLKRIVRINEPTGEVEVIRDDGQQHTYMLCDLKADDGIREVYAATERVTYAQAKTNASP